MPAATARWSTSRTGGPGFGMGVPLATLGAAVVGPYRLMVPYRGGGTWVDGHPDHEAVRARHSGVGSGRVGSGRVDPEGGAASGEGGERVGLQVGDDAGVAHDLRA